MSLLRSHLLSRMLWRISFLIKHAADFDNEIMVQEAADEDVLGTPRNIPTHLLVLFLMSR